MLHEYILPCIAQIESAYLLTNGEFNLDGVGQYYAFGWFVFFLATVFNLIIMLNLLLSIIAETFGRVIQKSHETMFKERVYEITNLQRSIGRCIR